MKLRSKRFTIFTVTTKRGEARVATTGIAKGEPFGINKATRRLRKQAA